MPSWLVVTFSDEICSDSEQIESRNFRDSNSESEFPLISITERIPFVKRSIMMFGSHYPVLIAWIRSVRSRGADWAGRPQRCTEKRWKI